MKTIEAKNIKKTFQDGDRETQVLKGIDISINKGEFLSITGASGTGKSTLIYLIGLLDDVTSGEIFINGKDIKDMNVDEKTKYRLDNFGFVFQDYALIPELNAVENVALPMLMRGSTHSEAVKRAEEVLASLDMKERVEYFPSELSGGESQRVSIARAIVHEPDVLFSDEPTANLDSQRSRQVIDLFHKLHKGGQTIVMVTHELEYAKEASRLIVLDDGMIIKDEKLKYGI